MKKLNQCLAKIEVEPSQAKRLRLLAQEYQQTTKDKLAAQRMAAEDLLNELLDERDDIVAQIKSKGGVVEGEEDESRDEVTEPAVEPEPEAVAPAPTVEAAPEKAPEVMEVRAEPEVQETKSPERAQGLPADKVRAKLYEAFGKDGIDHLERSGVLKIMSIDRLPPRIKAAVGPTTNALYDQRDQTAYLLLERATDANVKRILLHELGEHHALPTMLGARNYNRLLNDVRRMIAEGGDDPKFAAAVAHVRDHYDLAESSDLFIREVIARYGEDPGTAAWWQQLLSEIRQFLFTLGITKELTEQDLQLLVQKALRKTMDGKIKRYDARGDEILEIEARDVNTDTPEFANWFGESRLRNSQGEPVPFYHSSDAVFAEFSKDKAATSSGHISSGLGHFFTPYRKTSERYGQNTMKVYLRMEKPYRMDVEELSSFDTVEQAQKRAKELQDQGYDGIFVPMDKTAIVFDSNQVKSATHNIGAYSRYSRNIYESRGDDLATAGLPDETKPQALIRLMADQFNRWDQALKYLEKKAPGMITGATDIVSKEKLFYGKAENDSKQMERRFVQPIEKLLRGNNIPLAQFDRFNRARHAKERNEAVAKINPAMPDGGSGLKTADAEKFMAGLTAKERMVLTQANDLLVEMNRWRLKMQLDAGMITPGEYEVLTQKYRHYVPLKTIEDPEEVQDGLGSVGYAVRGKEWKQALGRSSEADSPFLVSIMDANRSILRARKAEIGQAVYKLAQNPQARDLFVTLDPKELPEEFQIKKTYKVAEKAADGKLKKDASGKTLYREEVRIGIDPSYPNARNVFPVKAGGEVKYVLIKDDLLAEQIKKLGETDLGPIMEALNKATSLLGRMFTQYNPAFVPINHFRDLMAVSINSLAVPGMNSGKVIAGTYQSYPAIWSYLFKDGSHPGVAEYQEFLNEGATIGGLGLRTLGEMQKAIQRRGVRLDENQTSARDRMLGQLENLAQWVSNLNEVVENATRFSVYRNAKQVFLDQGMKPADARQKAAVLAREISVDFNKRGERSRALNSFYVFFNASVQGMQSFYRFAIKSPHRQRVIQALFGLMAMGVMTRLFNQVAGGWDDELGEERALAIGARADNAVPILLGRGENAITIPLPFIYNLPFALGYRATDAMLTGKVGENLGEFLKAILQSSSPLGEPKESSTPIGAMVKTFTPSLLTPIAEITDNTNRYGKPIAPTPSQWDKSPPPDSTLYWNTASEAGKWIAEMLNRASGGDEIKPGAISISPEWIDHLTAYYTGGVGRTLVQGMDLLAKGRDPLEDVTPSDIPVLSRIVVQTQPEFYAKAKFREIAKELDYAREYREQRQFDKLTEAQKRTLPIWESTEKSIAQLNKQLRAARDRKDTAAEQQIEERLDQQRKRVVRVYNLAEGRLEPAFNGATRDEMRDAAKAAGYDALSGLLQ